MQYPNKRLIKPFTVSFVKQIAFNELYLRGSYWIEPYDKNVCL